MLLYLIEKKFEHIEFLLCAIFTKTCFLFKSLLSNIIIVLYKIIGITPWIILGIFIISLVGEFVASPIVSSICILLSAAITIYQSYMLSKSFGKGIGYTLGLIFLSPIFTLMLAFGGAKYVGPGGK